MTIAENGAIQMKEIVISDVREIDSNSQPLTQVVTQPLTRQVSAIDSSIQESVVSVTNLLTEQTDFDPNSSFTVQLIDGELDIASLQNVTTSDQSVQLIQFVDDEGHATITQILSQPEQEKISEGHIGRSQRYAPCTASRSHPVRSRRVSG